MTNKIEIKAWMYDILKRPLITEKSTFVAEKGQVVFEVSREATKKTIKEAVEALYKTKVASINILNTTGKVKKFRGKTGARQDMKKAYITLVDGSNVDFTSIN